MRLTPMMKASAKNRAAINAEPSLLKPNKRNFDERMIPISPNMAKEHAA